MAAPSLDQLRRGQRGRITRIDGGDSLVQRLMEMGLLEGEVVEVVGFAPSATDGGATGRLPPQPPPPRSRPRPGRTAALELAAIGLVPTTLAMPLPPRPTAALVGNPNTGKTTLFNALSGLRQRVGNYPGVTVETKKGQMTCGGRTFDVIDLPGTYSLAPRSPDEMVAVDVVLGCQKGEARPDVVVSIVDASNLDRNLYLTTQALELGVPVVVALNMVDVAEGQGIRIDADRLGRQLGVPVVPIQANKGKGLDELRQAVAAAALDGRTPKGPTFPEAFEREVETLRQAVGPDTPLFLVRRLLLDVGGYTEKRLVDRLGPAVAEQVKAARERLSAAGCPAPGRRGPHPLRLDSGGDGRLRAAAGQARRHLDRPHRPRADAQGLGHADFPGPDVRRLPVDLRLGQAAHGRHRRRQGHAGRLAARRDAGRPATSLLVGGVIEGVGTVVQFMPQILILFGFIAVLEDCGYMARAAFLMDKLMARCGLSGKSFIPMLSSVACAMPGIMAARVIENRRDRLATILVAPLMSCSARLPVYVLLIGAFLSPPVFPWWTPGLVMFLMYSIGLVAAPLVALALKRTLLRGETPAFVMEMPLYKVPSLAHGAGPDVRQRLGVRPPGRHADPGVDGAGLGAVVLPARPGRGVAYDAQVARPENEAGRIEVKRPADEEIEAKETRPTSSAANGSGRACWA